MIYWWCIRALFGLHLWSFWNSELEIDTFGTVQQGLLAHKTLKDFYLPQAKLGPWIRCSHSLSEDIYKHNWLMVPFVIGIKLPCLDPGCVHTCTRRIFACPIRISLAPGQCPALGCHSVKAGSCQVKGCGQRKWRHGNVKQGMWKEGMTPWQHWRKECGHREWCYGSVNEGIYLE